MIGGQGNVRSETCEITGEIIECKSREPTLNNFQQYPAMMIIEPSYTEQCKVFSTVDKNSTSNTLSQVSASPTKATGKNKLCNFLCFKELLQKLIFW